jgi:hypothetical protein
MLAGFFRRSCLLALTAAAAVITSSPAANAVLFVGGQQWPKDRLTTFVNTIDLAGYLGKIRAKFIPNLIYFMTESGAVFNFENEGQLKTELISEYIDEHMKGLSSFQSLAHDDRGATFIRKNFNATGYLKWRDNQVQAVSARNLTIDSGAQDLGRINLLLNDPSKELPQYMTKRPEGNLWIFRTMSKRSAQFMNYNFDTLRTQARIVAPMIVAGNPQAAAILQDQHLFSAPDIEFALNGHFGDLFQALTYNDGVDGGDKILVGFKIKTGAELVMYSPLVMVLTGEHVDATGYAIAQAMLEKFGRVNQGSGADGIVRGYLSIKHEARGDFSFGLSKDPASIVLFCLLISDFQIYGNID